MKTSLWYNGRHIELEGTKEEIMDFLGGLKQPEITFTGLPSGTTSPDIHWGGLDANTQETVPISDNMYFQNDNVIFNAEPPHDQFNQH